MRRGPQGILEGGLREVREGRSIVFTPSLSRGRRDARPTKEAPAEVAPGHEPGGGPGDGVGLKGDGHD